MFNLTDISAAIMESAMQTIEPMLKVCVCPKWSRHRDLSISLEVELGGVTFCYIAEDPSGLGENPVYDALRGGSMDDGGVPMNHGVFWDVVVDVKNGEDPFLDIARHAQKPEGFVGSPWEAMEYAKRFLVTWIIQAGGTSLLEG